MQVNDSLWQAIENFSLDYPLSEYSFSIRLSYENGWPANFTQKAITEYKKFMYLAATSDAMVSPSEIIDVVWHQHLIFTQSYDAFCQVLGKKIEHIPSSRKRDEFEKFKLAKERTTKLYLDCFGEPPAEVWRYSEIYEALAMPKAKFKVSEVALYIILTCLGLIIPAFFILEPIYKQIEGSLFLAIYIPAVLLLFFVLFLIDEIQLKKAVLGWQKDAFIFNLSPFELLYLKTKQVYSIIHACVNMMIEQNKIIVSGEYTLGLNPGSDAKNAAQFAIIDAMYGEEKIPYYQLLQKLRGKPVFLNAESMSIALKKYINKSDFFVRLFTLNFSFLSVVFFLGFMRLVTGIVNGRPVGFLVFSLIAFIIGIVFFLKWLHNLHANAILNYYNESVLPDHPEVNEWAWRYYLLGGALLYSAFAPMTSSAEQRLNSNYSGDSSSGGCGSSCGSSCGGGCGGGCGGCGG